jgi:RNA polymerase sigma factor (sigma-70 family)
VTEHPSGHRPAVEPESRRAVVDPHEGAVREAVAAIRRGDRTAFARLVQLYERRLFSLSVMMTLDAYDERGPFYPWLATISVRLAQNWLTRRTRISRREGTQLQPEFDIASATVDPLSELIADESDRRLWQTVAALPYGERTTVILYYRQDMTVRDIARAMGVTGGTVKTMLFRARHTVGDTRSGKERT